MRLCCHGSLPLIPGRSIPAQPHRTLLARRLLGAAGWPPEAHLLVGRADLAAQAAAPQPGPHGAADVAPPAVTLIERLPAAGDTPAAQRPRRRGATAAAAADEAEAAPRAPPGQGGVPPYQQRLFQPGTRTQATDATSWKAPTSLGEFVGHACFTCCEGFREHTSQGAACCSRRRCGPRPGVG
jgi:hypothetical protein